MSNFRKVPKKTLDTIALLIERIAFNPMTPKDELAVKAALKAYPQAWDKLTNATQGDLVVGYGIRQPIEKPKAKKRKEVSTI